MPSSLSSIRGQAAGRTWEAFALNSPKGQTAAPGNAASNALAGCTYTLPAAGAQVGGQLRVAVAGRKGANNATDVINLRLRVGATAPGTELASFGFNLAADTRSFGGIARWRFDTATLIRRVGAVAGLNAEAAQVTNTVAAGTTDTIPNITTSPLVFTLYGALSVGTAEWIVIDDFSIQILAPF